MKNIILLEKILIIFVILFSICSCETEPDENYKQKNQHEIKFVISGNSSTIDTVFYSIHEIDGLHIDVNKSYSEVTLPYTETLDYYGDFNGSLNVYYKHDYDYQVKVFIDGRLVSESRETGILNNADKFNYATFVTFIHRDS